MLICNGRRTAEHWINEEKNAVNWPQPSWRDFADN